VLEEIEVGPAGSTPDGVGRIRYAAERTEQAGIPAGLKRIAQPVLGVGPLSQTPHDTKYQPFDLRFVEGRLLEKARHDAGRLLSSWLIHRAEGKWGIGAGQQQHEVIV
jgi:hypothetical protein